MLKYFVDDCEFGGPFHHTVLNGGIIIDSKYEMEMVNDVENFKLDRCGKKFVPVKYNLKDLRKFYEKYDLSDVYITLLEDYDHFRLGLLDVINKYEYKILVSCMRAFKTNKKFIIKTKDKLRRFSFVMCLMRYALEVECNDIKEGEIVFDFPTGSNPEPLNKEYMCAYRKGKSFDEVVYKAGPLLNLGFKDSLYFSSTYSSALLQVLF